MAVVEVCRQAGNYRADLLSVEEAVRGIGNRPCPAAQAASGRECEAEEIGGRAEFGQDNVAGCARKKIVKPSRRRPVVNYLGGVYRVSQRRACEVARIPVSTFRYQSTQEPRTALRLRIREIAQARIRYGYRKIRVLLKREGWNVGKKLVYRLYCEEGLALRYKPRRRRCAAANRRERGKVTAPNQVVESGLRRGSASGRTKISSIDHRRCIHEGKSSHRSRAKLEGSRCGAGTEPNLLEASHSENAFLRQRIGVHQLKRWIYGRIMPECGSIFRGRESRPITRMWNRSTARFDRSAWTPIGSRRWRRRKQIIEAWRQEYNESRPHRALGERTPNEFTSTKTAGDSLSE